MAENPSFRIDPHMQVGSGYVGGPVKSQWGRVSNVRNTCVDSYTVVVMTELGNSMWAARKRSMIALLRSP